MLNEDLLYYFRGRQEHPFPSHHHFLPKYLPLEPENSVLRLFSLLKGRERRNTALCQSLCQSFAPQHEWVSQILPKATDTWGAFCFCLGKNIYGREEEGNRRACSLEKPLERGKYRRDKLGASLIYFRIFIGAKPPGQCWCFRNSDVSKESIWDIQGKLDYHTMLLQGLETTASFSRFIHGQLLTCHLLDVIYAPEILLSI